MSPGLALTTSPLEKERMSRPIRVSLKPIRSTLTRTTALTRFIGMTKATVDSQ